MLTLHPRLGSLNLLKLLPKNKATVAQGKLFLEIIFKKKPQGVNVKASLSLSTLRINVIVYCVIE
jgi:hypothetical protein